MTGAGQWPSLSHSSSIEEGVLFVVEDGVAELDGVDEVVDEVVLADERPAAWSRAIDKRTAAASCNWCHIILATLIDAQLSLNHK